MTKKYTVKTSCVLETTYELTQAQVESQTSEDLLDDFDFPSLLEVERSLETKGEWENYHVDSVECIKDIHWDNEQIISIKENS